MSGAGQGYGEGFFYTPEDQAAQQQIRRRQDYAKALLQGQGHQGQYGGLADAGSSIAGALLAKRADKDATGLASSAQAKMVEALKGIYQGNNGSGASPQVSNMAGSPQEMAGALKGPALDPEGNPVAMSEQPRVGPAPQAMSEQGGFADRIARSGNPALMMQFLPQIAQSQMGRENKIWENQQPMSVANQQQIAAQGTQAQQNAQFTNQLPMTAAQQATIAQQRAQMGETSRHNRVEEGIAQNPFGMGMASAMGKTGPEFLSEIAKTNPGLAAQLTAVGTYRQPAPAGRTSPTGIKFMTMVNQAFPSFDASQYGAKTKARNDFATGKNGNTVRSLNVAVQHLDQLGQLSEAMGNGDVQAVNKIGNYFASQTGQPAPSNFNAAKQLVGDEIVKAIVGTGGGVSDREEAAHNISAASSPQQLAGVIKTYQGLLSGQLVGLKQQYEKSTGLQDFEDYLAPETKAKLQAHGTGGIVPAQGAAAPRVIRYDASGKRLP